MKKFLLSLGLTASALSASGQVTLAKYLPETAPTTSQTRAPNGTTNHTTLRAHFIIPASEVTGIPAGIQFSKVGFVLSAGASVPFSGNIRLYLENTSDATNQKSNNWPTAISTMTEIYNGTYSVQAGAGNQEVNLPASPGFTYTGGGLYIAFDYAGSTFTTSLQDGATYRANSVLSGSLYMNNSSSTTPGTTLNAVSAFRPQMRFEYLNPYSDEISVEAIDAGLLHPNKLIQGTATVRALIRNGSNTVKNNVSVSLNVSGANPATDLQSIPSLAAGDTTTIVFSNISIQNDGSQTLAVSVPPDDINSNNLLMRDIFISCDTLGHSHNGTPDDAIGYGSGSGILAVRYINGAGFFPVIRGINALIANDATSSGKEIAGVILDRQGNILSRSPKTTLVPANLGKELYFALNTPQTIAPLDTFYIGLIQYPSVSAYYPAGTHYPANIANDIVFGFDTLGGNKAMYNNLGMLLLEAIISHRVTLSGGPDSICSGQSVTFSASAGYTSYDFMVNGSSNQVSASDTYSFSPAQNSGISVLATYNNCSTLSQTDSVFVFQQALTQLSATICEGQTYVLGSQVLNSSGNYTEYFKVPGVFCDSVVELSLNVNMVDESVLQNDSLLTAVATGASYMWLNCDNNTIIAGAAAQSFIPAQSGNYAVIVSQNGCSDTSACKSVKISTGLNEAAALQAILIYPNPANDYITIELPAGITAGRVVLTDINGRVLEQIQTNATEKQTISTQVLKPGVYLLQIHTPDGTAVRRFIKQ